MNKDLKHCLREEEQCIRESDESHASADPPPLTEFLLRFPESVLHNREGQPLEWRLSNAIDEIVKELSGKFRRFLTSVEYTRWRAVQRSSYSALFLRSSIVFESEPEEYASDANGSYIEYNSATVLQSIDPEELNRLINSDMWLTTLLARAETLPIGITLLSADHIRTGFPFVYVNSFYETHSGVSKSSMLGRGWRSLLAADETPRLVEAVHTAVKLAKLVKTVMRFPALSGESFWGVMCLKPLFDSKGQYMYMLGIHLKLDEDTPEQRKKYLQLADMLSGTLPHVLKDAKD